MYRVEKWTWELIPVGHLETTRAQFAMSNWDVDGFIIRAYGYDRFLEAIKRKYLARQQVWPAPIESRPKLLYWCLDLIDFLSNHYWLS